jgi:hypothetical protein
MENSTIISRITKLLALSKSSNVHEAELAMEKANELMTKHQITMAQVMSDQTPSNNTVTGVWYKVPDLKMKLKFVQIIGLAAAELFDCTILVMGSELHQTSIYFIGTPADIELSKSMFEFLWLTWKTEVAVDLTLAKSRSTFRFSPSDTMKFRQGHGVGFSMTVRNRVLALVHRRHAEVQCSSKSGKELVLVKSTAVKEFANVASNGAKAKRTRSSVGSQSGYESGVAAGNRARLGHKEIQH